MVNRRRFVQRPPEHLKDRDLRRFLYQFQEEILDHLADVEAKAPSEKTEVVTAVSRGEFKEITVVHSLGVRPSGFTVVDAPRGDYKFRKSRETIGSQESAFFESDAPKGKKFLVRLEV